MIQRPFLSRELQRMLDETGALLEGHFLLSSGRHSPYYLQCAKLCAHPRVCEHVAGEIADKVRRELGNDPCDLVLSPALGGVVIGYEVARQLGKPSLFAERDTSRQMQLRRGFHLDPGTRVLLVEDVITTGGSIMEVHSIVEESGCKTVGFGCIFDRSAGEFKPGPPVFSVAKLEIPTFSAEQCPLEGDAVKPGSR